MDFRNRTRRRRRDGDGGGQRAFLYPHHGHGWPDRLGTLHPEPSALSRRFRIYWTRRSLLFRHVDCGRAGTLERRIFPARQRALAISEAKAFSSVAEV